MGSGKTNFMTAILKINLDSGREVAANYFVRFKYRLTSFEELAQLPEDIVDLDIGIDELGTGADSYEFFSNTPKKLGLLVTQLRKRHCRVWYTVQRFSFITKRLRIMTDGFILCEDLDKSENHLAPGFDCNSLFKLTFYNRDFKMVNSEIFDGRPYRDLYDTDEIVFE